MKTNRRQCREEALQLIYADEFNSKNIDDLLSESSVIRDDESKFDPFTIELTKMALFKADECNKLIEVHTSNWSFDRIALIDRIILRLALTEFLYFNDIPPKVTINEFLEIAKKYSTVKSSTFINGVLDSILSELKKKKKILKEGRGLK